MNTIFGKIENGKLVLAPSVIIIEDKQIISNDASVYLQYGYKKIMREPYPPDTKIVYNEQYIENETTITISWKEDLEGTRQLKLSDLEIYDTSDEVNGFLVGDHHMWLDGLERCKLEQGIKDCMALGRETYGLCIPEVGVVDLPCETILDMLAQLNVYAVDCFKTTFLHEEAIKSLSTIEEIEAYDFTTGYPPKLSFPIV